MNKDSRRSGFDLNQICIKIVSGLALLGLTGVSLPIQARAEAPVTEAIQGSSKAYPQVLIYNGDSTAFGDAESLASILDQHQVSYQLASSEALNQMSLDEMAQYQLIIWPGGYAGQMSASLDASTREELRLAVNDRGVSFFGICAGAFIAVSPPKEAGEAGPSWGLSVLPAPQLLDYYHLEDEGISEAMVDVLLPGNQSRSLVWWGGPKLPEVPNGVIARYPDTREPAITQTQAGKGFVILSGPHPEAPLDWRDKLGLDDPDGHDFDLAWSLAEAALHRQPLPVVD